MTRLPTIVASQVSVVRINDERGRHGVLCTLGASLLRSSPRWRRRLPRRWLLPQRLLLPRWLLLLPPRRRRLLPGWWWPWPWRALLTPPLVLPSLVLRRWRRQVPPLTLLDGALWPWWRWVPRLQVLDLATVLHGTLEHLLVGLPRLPLTLNLSEADSHRLLIKTIRSTCREAISRLLIASLCFDV